MARRHTLVGWIAFISLSFACVVGAARAQTRDDQRVLGPGMYVFQTRTTRASCDDDERTGYVSSFVAPIHGVPGASTMRMQLLNSPYWSTWSVTVQADGRVVAESTLDGAEGPNAPTNRFEVRREGDRFTGTGVRRYRSGSRQCEVRYDALLRRIDL